MLPFKKGAFHLAIQGQMPIVPIVASSYHDVYNLKRCLFEGGLVRVKVLPPIPTAGLTTADVDELMVHVRDAQGQSSSVEGFLLRFANLNELDNYGVSVIKRILGNVVKDSQESNAKVEQIESIKDLRGAVYDGLMVVSTNNPDPIAAFSQITPQTTSLPPIFEKGFIDPEMPLKHYLLVHDPVAAVNVDAEMLFQQMKKTFGLSCHLVQVNSNKGLQDSRGSIDIWQPFMNEHMLLRNASDSKTEPSPLPSPRLSTVSLTLSPSGEIDLTGDGDATTGVREDIDAPKSSRYGSLVSESDIRGFEAFVKEFLVQSVLPNMERKVQHWNEQVASSRRGLTARLFTAGRRYFGNQTRATTLSASTESLSTIAFPHSSQELILRRLADYSFMLRDYKFAHNIYDTVKKDFQGNDRAIKHFAGTQEMLALCVLISDGLRGDLDSLLDSAVGNYQDIGSSIFAARATMLVFELIKQREQYKDASNLLMRMIGEDSHLRSALLLEQCAYSYAKMSPQRMRKFAFYIVLAGHRFNKCQMRHHAHRCYSLANKLYEGSSWTLVEDHIHFSLGRQAFHLGNLEDAYNYFMQLLHSSSQSGSQQSAYLKEFCHIFTELERRASKEVLDRIPPVCIPLIDSSSIKVLLSENQSNQVTQEDELWETMEKQLLDDGFNNTLSVSEKLTKAAKSARQDTTTVCAVGEAAFLSFEVENPLQTSIHMDDMHLSASFKDKDGALSPDDSERGGRLNESDAFDVEHIFSLSLGPLEKRTISLRITPRKEGEVLIKGVCFMFAGQVPTFRRISKRVLTKKEGTASATEGVDHLLSLKVTPPMPVLEVVFHAFPSVLLSGQVEPTVLEINNKGNRGLCNLKLKLSHPSFFSIGGPDAIDTPSYKLPRNESSAVPVLGPGQTTIIPIWIRGDRIGKQQFRFLFAYQSEEKLGKSNLRTLKYSMTTQVQPSLRINAFTRPSTSILQEFVLGIEVENLQPSTKVKLRQITALSPAWSISPAEDLESERPQFELPEKQTLFVYFRFKQLPHSDTFDHAKSPEMMTTRAIEGFLLGDESRFLKDSPLNLHVTSLSFSSNVGVKENPFHSLSRNSRVQWRTQSLASQYPFLPPAKIKDIFTLYYTDDVDIALLWEAPGLTPDSPPRQGHHYIIGINLGLQSPLQLQARLNRNAILSMAPTRSLYAATHREKKALVDSLFKSKVKDISPIRLVVKAESEYIHDFATQGNLVIKIEALLRNTSWDNQAHYSLEMIPSDRQQTLGPNELFTHYYWVGKMSSSGHLAAREERTEVFYANFTRKGTFDINRWKLTVTVSLPEIVDATGSPVVAGSHSASYVQAPNFPQYLSIK
ncbi:Trafficking protein particle complex 8 [Blyttiomyces sp. JEL0837]|nr:Trafficking protein particle complex 8 [Blyttiomyces sp. JEL0837]